MENLLKLADKNRKAELYEDKLIQQHCSRFALAAECFYSRLPKFFKDTFALQVDAVPGFPGKDYDTFLSLSSAFQVYTESLYKLECYIKFQTAETFNTILHLKDVYERAYQDALSAFKTLNSTIEIQNKLSCNLAPQIRAMNEIVTKLGKKAPSSKQVSQLTEIIQAVYQSREMNRSTTDKLRSSQIQSEEKFKQAMKSVGDFYFQRDSSIFTLLQNITLSFTQLTADINLANASIQDTSKALDYSSELRSFTERIKFFRQDIIVPPFEEIDVGDDDTSPIPPPRNPFGQDIPIGLARAISSFNAEGETEMDLISQRMYYLLETPSQEWCYVMNPFTAQKGFVPSVLLKIDSSTLGILVREPPRDVKVMLKKDNIVGVIGQIDGTQNYLCLTIYGDQTILPMEIVAMIYTEPINNYTVK